MPPPQARFLFFPVLSRLKESLYTPRHNMAAPHLPPDRQLDWGSRRSAFAVAALLPLLGHGTTPDAADDSATLRVLAK